MGNVSLPGVCTDGLYRSKYPLGSAAPVTFSVASGTYPTTQTAALSSLTPNAVIYATTDGTTPTSSSPVYTAPITVGASVTLNAICVAPGYFPSLTATAVYTIASAQTATPVITPAAGNYSAAQTVTITDATAGATIYVTTDGTTPTSSSPVYTGPFTVATSSTVRALAAAGGFSPSAVASSAYTIGVTQVSTPTFLPPGGAYSASQSVVISDSTASAAIYYTTNGTTPTTASTLYSAPVAITANTTLQAIAVKSGLTNSAVGEAIYNIGAGVNNAQIPYAPSGSLKLVGASISNGTQLGVLQGSNVSSLELSDLQNQASDWSENGGPPNWPVLKTWMGNVTRIMVSPPCWLGLSCAILSTATTVTFTAAPAFGSTSGTLTAGWALPSGPYPIMWNGVGQAPPWTIGNFTQGSTAVTWATLDMSGSNKNSPSATPNIVTVASFRNADLHGTYRQSVITAVAAAQAIGHNVILDNHWSAPQTTIGNQTVYLMPAGQPQFANADTDVNYWSSIASVFGNAVPPQPGINNGNILFEPFNEPFLKLNHYMLTTTQGGSVAIDPDSAKNSSSAWCSGFIAGNGGPGVLPCNWQLASYQSMVNAIRANGSTNICIINGDYYTQELSYFRKYLPSDPANQLCLGWHDYAPNDGGANAWPYTNGNYYPRVGTDPGGGTSAAANSAIAAIQAGYHVICTEGGGAFGSAATASELYMAYTNQLSDLYGISRVRYRFTQTRPYGYTGPQASDGPFQTVSASDGVTIVPIGGSGQVAWDWQRAHRGPLMINRDVITPCIPHVSSGSASALNSYTGQWRSSQGAPSVSNPITASWDISYQTKWGLGQVKICWFCDQNSNYDGFADGNVPFYDGPGAYNVQTNTAPGGTYPTSGWVTVATRQNPYAGTTLISQARGEEIVQTTGGVNWVQLQFTAGNGSISNTDVSMFVDLYDTTFCASNGGVAVDSSFFFMGDSIDEHDAHYGNLGDGVNPTLTCAGFPAIVRAGGFITATSNLIGGSGYTNGVYPSVLLTGGSGAGAVANITVSGGAVTAVSPTAIIGMGYGFKVGDVLSVPNTQIGGTGSGATVKVATLQAPSRLQGYQPVGASGGQGGWKADNWATYLTTQYTTLFTSGFAGQNVCIKLGTNGSGATSNWQAQMGTIITNLQAAGKTVYLEYPPPSPNSLSWLAGYVADYPTLLAAYPGVQTGFNMYNSTYTYLDGLHPNAYGSVSIRVGRAQYYSSLFI